MIRAVEIVRPSCVGLLYITHLSCVEPLKSLVELYRAAEDQLLITTFRHLQFLLQRRLHEVLMRASQ